MNTGRIGRLAFIVSLFTVSLFSTLVASAAQPVPGTPATPDAATALLQSASVRLAQTLSLHFTINVDGDAYIDDQDTIRLIEAEGDVVRPDRVIASFKVNVLNLSLIHI